MQCELLKTINHNTIAVLLPFTRIREGWSQGEWEKSKGTERDQVIKRKGGCGGDLDTLERVSEKRGVLSTNIWKSSWMQSWAAKFSLSYMRTQSSQSDCERAQTHTYTDREIKMINSCREKTHSLTPPLETGCTASVSTKLDIQKIPPTHMNYLPRTVIPTTNRTLQLQ